MIPLTDEEKESYEKQKVCPICKKEFSTDKKYCKFRDHFHNTGIFRGAPHNNCSLRYKIPKEIPVVFTKKKKKCELCKKRKILSGCNYIGIKNNRLHYKCKECNDESYKSINELIKKFPNVYQFCNGDLSKFALLLRKVVYPYEYIDSWERFNETSLPDKKDFFCKLKLEGITDEDYAYVQKVWEVS